MEIYDISQTVREGIGVWPGDKKFRREWTMRIAKKDACNVSAISTTVHVGTHLDAPYHFDESGPDIASISLEKCIGPVRVVELSVDHVITPEDLQVPDWQGVQRVLFKTRASDTPEDRFDREFPYLSDDAATFLGERRLLLVGTDAPSVDAFSSKTMTVHRILLKHGTAILEGIRLAHVPAGDFELIALPLRLQGLDASPVRAILRR